MNFRSLFKKQTLPDSPMTIESSEKHSEIVCDCCGATVLHRYGFLSGQGKPLGIYYASLFSHHDQPKVVCLAIGLGDWSKSPFVCDYSGSIFAHEHPNQLVFEITSPDDSPWKNVSVLGTMMSREALKASDLKPIFLQIAEFLVLHEEAIIKHWNGKPR